MRVNKISSLLWIAQLLLAALYLFAGGAKLALPSEALRGPIPLAAGVIAALVVYGRRDWLLTSSWVSRRTVQRAPAPHTDDPVRRVA